MAVKATDAKLSAKAATPAQPVEVTPGQTMTEVSIKGPAAPYRGDCVVDDGTIHNGQAVNGGKVCSAHENRYYPDGKRRGQ